MEVRKPDPTVVFPCIQVGSWVGWDTSTSSGLFVSRFTQAIGLLELPDFAGSDLDADQRKEALSNWPTLMRPLTALSLFLGTVALEDFVRDLVVRMSLNNQCETLFPGLSVYRPTKLALRAEKLHRPHYTDLAGKSDPDEVNAIFRDTLGISPIASVDKWHLRDLITLRHIVAHFAAIVRPEDIPRFGYFIVDQGMLNPPPEFVKAELVYLCKIGYEIEKAAGSCVLKKIIENAGAGWSRNPPQEVVSMIEFFGFFGRLEKDRGLRLDHCINELVTQHGP